MDIPQRYSGPIISWSGQDRHYFFCTVRTGSVRLLSFRHMNKNLVKSVNTSLPHISNNLGEIKFQGRSVSSVLLKFFIIPKSWVTNQRPI